MKLSVIGLFSLALLCSCLSIVLAEDWTKSAWSECSEPCGTGIQVRNVTCTLGRIVKEDKLCAGKIKPLPAQHCNTQRCPTREVEAFSCQTEADCPAQYNQGGLLTVTIVKAVNLPDMDGGGVAGGLSDPYVKVSIAGGQAVRTTERVRGATNPVWTEGNELFFDMQYTLSDVLLEVYDYDLGFEGEDDKLGSVAFKVPGCSEWQREVCSEETWLMLDGGANPHCNDTVTPCVRVRVDMTPLKITISEEFDSDSEVGKTTIARVVDSADPGWTAMYTSLEAKPMVVDGGRFRAAKGGTIVKTRESDALSTRHPYLVFTINVNSRIYILREFSDSGGFAAWDATKPNWLQPESGYITGDTYVRIEGEEKQYRGMEKYFSAGSTVVIGSPRDGISEASFPDAMFGIVIKPLAFVDEDTSVEDVEFDRTKFLIVGVQYIFPLLFFTWMVASHLSRVQYRMDLTVPYLLLKTLPLPVDIGYDLEAAKQAAQEAQNGTAGGDSDGDEAEGGAGAGAGAGVTTTVKPLAEDEEGEKKNKLFLSSSKTHSALLDSSSSELVACMFEAHLKDGSIDNKRFRRSAFFAKWAVWVIVITPIVIVVSWGAACAFVVSPPALGYFITFIVSGIMILYAGCRAWYSAGWRMMPGVLVTICLFVACCFAFLLAVVYGGTVKLSLFGINTVLLSLNMVPMVLIVFLNSRGVRKAYDQMQGAVSRNKRLLDTVKGALSRAGSSKKSLWAVTRSKRNLIAAQSKRETSAAFRTLAGEVYTVDPHHPSGFFKLTDTLSRLFGAKNKILERISQMLYLLSVLILMWLAITVWAHDDAANTNQGLASMLTVLVLDMGVYLLHRGDLSWSPGFLLFLMAASRACVCAFVGEMWLAGHSLAYFVFGLFLGLEIVGRRLPRMSQKSASGVAYFGLERRSVKTDDVAGSPEFVLAFLSFAFLLLLLAAVFGSGDIPDIDILGWMVPTWVFGLSAFLLVLVVCSSTATIRALSLQRARILHLDWYFVCNLCSMPMMLAAVTEILLVTSGLLLMAITDSTLIVTLAVFMPVLMVIGFRIYSQWVSNDYQLLEPPENRASYQAKMEDGLDHKPDPEAGDKKQGEEEDIVEPNLYDPNVVAGHAPTPGASLVGGSLNQAARAPIHLPPLQREDSVGAGDAKLVMPVMPSTLPDLNASAAGMGAGAALMDGAAGDAKAAAGEGDEKAVPDVDTGAPPNPETLKDRTFKKFKFNASKWMAAPEDGQESDLAAFFKCRLTKKDYGMVFSIILWLGVVMTMGLVTANYQNQVLGHSIWFGIYVLVATLIPVIKYYNTYQWSIDMKLMFGFGFLTLFVAAMVFFVVYLEADVNNELSLWTLQVLIMYPCTILFFSSIYHWKDHNWTMTKYVKIAMPISFFLYFVWVVIMYIWGNPYVGFSLTAALVVTGIILLFLKKWAENDYYIPPNYSFVGSILIAIVIIIAIVIGLLADVNLFYCFSVGFLFLAFRFLGRAFSHYLARPPDSPLYFSSWLFPMYRYNPVTHNIVSENHFGADVVMGLGVALLWGCFATIFISPIGIGIAITCAVIMVSAVVVLYAVSHAPMLIGSAARFLDEAMIKHAAEEAQAGFESRRHALKITCDEFEERDKREEELNRQLDRYAAPGAKHHTEDKWDANLHRETAGELAFTIHDIMRHLRYRMRDEEDDKRDDEVEAAFQDGAPPNRSVKFQDDASTRALLAHKNRPQWLSRDDRIFNTLDMIEDFWTTGEGPLGWLGIYGIPYGIYSLYCSDTIKKSKIYTSTHKRRRPRAPLPCQDSAAMLRGLWYRHQALSREYYEEQRLIAHFQTLLMVAAEAKLRTEAVLFQKFLREYRFKLIANGVNPPEDIFRTQSYATVDVQLVASWLLKLTPEQRDRFRQLKARFTAEVDAQYEMRMIADREQAETAAALLWSRRAREHEMWQKRWLDFQQRRINRRKQGIDRPGVPEEEINNEEIIQEIEAQHLYCRQGIHGRDFQFHDPEFPHDETSLGPCQRLSMVEGWKVSTGININSGLFVDGTDPDDVFQGQLADGWLLSAISILAASGGVGDGDVDELVDRLFVTKETTETGVYAIRLWKNAQWETVVVDDFFPVLNNRFKSTRCAGAAFAYGTNMSELWVSVMEKAFAKYYGSYAELEQGYVHHALTDLTGFQSEEIFLAEASRGASKRQLWQNLLKFKKNMFLLGAGTILPSAHDRELMDSGLVFGAAYVIYDVRSVDGLKLLQLRNPPGDHGEWNGDWGDDSPLWTKRLKAKLGYVNDAEDGTFWMSFDDFCLAFRSLYVCRYYEPTKWHKEVRTGWWKGPLAAGLPNKHNPHCKLWLNPQFSLRVDRPTDICIILKQSLPDVHLYNNPQPVAIYIVALDNDEVVLSMVQGLPANAPEEEKRAFAGLGHETGTGGDPSSKAQRVRALTTTNVVTHSGKPRRDREITIYASLQPRMYTVLVAPYQRGMEGPFTLHLWSNYEVALRQIWPPPKDDDEAAKNQTLKEKLAARTKSGKALVAGKLKERMGGGLTEDEDAKLEEATDAEEALEALEEAEELVMEAHRSQEAQAASAWVEQYDPTTDRTYYYNMETGESQWEVPEELRPEGIGQGESEEKVTYGEKKKKKKEKEVETGPTCNICQHHRVKGQKDNFHRLWQADGRNARDLLECHGGCGARVHPVCAGFSDDYPPPDPWTCPVCGDEDDDF